MPSKKPTRVVKSARGKTPPGRLAAIGGKATAMVAICVMAAGMLVAARQQPRPAKAPAMETRAEMSPVTAAPERTYAASAPSLVSSAPAAPSAPKAPAVTVTGCLERAGESFRLKDTSGASAPKSRTWKSGFLKKGSATLDVVDAAHTLRLADHVGRRVSVTGPLVDREMRARSLRRVASSCLQQP
jgi:hypothetical protein